MTNTKHTPGPWEGQWELVHGFHSAVRNIVKAHDARLYPGNERFTVCVVDPESQMPSELVESYARLIATAPAMLEALEDVRNELVGLAAYLATCAPGTIIGNLETTVASLNKKSDELDAAIRLAVGETDQEQAV